MRESLRLRFEALTGRAAAVRWQLQAENDWPPSDLELLLVVGQALAAGGDSAAVRELVGDRRLCQSYFPVALAATLETKHGVQAAREVYQQIWTVCADQPAGLTALERLADLEYRAGQLPAALHWIAQLTRERPLEASRWAELARFQLEAGQFELARDTADYSLSLDSSLRNLGARAFRGIALLRLGAAEAALADLEQVEASGSTSPWNRVALAQAYWQTGRRDAARQTLALLLRASPDFEPAQRQLEAWSGLP
ncbi:MAG: tetratricopeptide repeat protein [Anaerolineales bacterium]|nr:tetratricopeptide repeat protein [Anaerolineales bacterium]